MKKHTPVIIKSTGQRGYLVRGINKRSTWASVYVFEKHYSCSVRVEDIEKAEGRR